MLATVGAYPFIDPTRDEHLFWNYVFVLVILTLAGALEAAALALVWGRERRRRRHALREQDVIEKRAEFYRSRTDSLERELELLSAMREVYRAANLDETLKEVLRVVKELAQAEEVALFLLDESGHKLFAQALIDDSGSYIGDAVEGRSPDDEGVSECFQHQSAFQAVTGDRLRLLVPLGAEAKPLGVLASTVGLTGDAGSQAQQAEGALLFLEDIAPHVAAVIRTTLLRTQAIRDSLTRLYNRAQFDRELERQIALARRRGRRLSLAMIDIDHFKQVNDTHGHQAGDEVLAAVGGILASNLREYDTAYRYGGEELALVLLDTTAKNARVLVERVRQAVKHVSFRGPGGKSFSVTLSAGVAQFDRQRMSEPKELVALADAALYRAKQGGRDRVAAAPAPAPSKARSPRRRKPRTQKRKTSGKEGS